MAIKRLERKDGTVYYAVEYRYPPRRGGQERREVAPTGPEATVLAGKIAKELLAGRDPRGSMITFEAHANEVLAKHYSKKRCHPWAKIVVEVHLIPAFGKLPLAKVTAKRITDYMHECTAKGLKPATINGHRAVLSKILSLADLWDRLPSDARPMRKVDKLEEHNGRERVLTPAEQRALIDAGNDARREHARDAAILSLGTGGRRKEVLGLWWSCVDLGRGLITFRAETTKNGKDRTVRASPAALAILKARHAARDAASTERERFCPHVLTYRGKAVRSINTGYRAMVKDAGLGRDVVFHTLRHTWATDLGHAGCDPRDLQVWGGWADLKMVERYYHTGAERSSRAVAAIGNHLLGPAPIQTPAKAPAEAAAK